MGGVVLAFSLPGFIFPWALTLPDEFVLNLSRLGLSQRSG